MILQNDYIKLTLDKKGAELRALFNLETNKDIMWKGDDTWWSGISPILFPFVGTSKNNQYTYKDKIYDMKPHGFLSQRIFDVISEKEDSVWFCYTSTDEDYMVYPFKFRIKIGYEIAWSTITVKWIVENLDDKTMIYTIGAHPSFLCDQGDILTFETKDEDTYFYSLQGPHILNQEKMEPKRLVMGDDAFPIDTWIYSGIKSASLLNLNKGTSVKLVFDDFDYVGIWSPVKNGKMGPFVCIEPWQGLPDYSDASGNLEEKKTSSHLKPQEKASYAYTIEIA